MNIFDHNVRAWERQVKEKSIWTIPASHEEVLNAQKGDWAVWLTPKKPVPRNWFPPLEGLDILCLASGGGQQGPILSAAGANVTVVDACPQQLEQDQRVAKREQLPLLTICADMANLSDLGDESFDLIVHPCSNCFVPDLTPVWNEAYRVLKKGGSLLSGFVNPIYYASDRDLQEKGDFQIVHPLPYSDLEHLEKKKLEQIVKTEDTLEFGHTLEDQIGGQIVAGFSITGFFEDYWGIAPLDKYVPQFIATKALKG